VVEREETRHRENREALLARIGTIPTEDEGLVDGVARWADPALDDAAWSTIPVPGLWEQAGYPGMDGVAWYRTTFTLTSEEAQHGARLAVGAVDDEDITWVNGVEVGRTQRYDAQRLYDVPATALRAGPNVVAVRVLDTGGGGGIWQQPEHVYVEVGGTRRSLAGTWKFRVAMVRIDEDGQQINKVPTVLYNRMVHPLLPFPIRGVIWYQGESNANEVAQAATYREHLATLIRSWRQEWGGELGAFPFLWVQLPNYGAVDTVPPDRAAWATLRESQTAALALPNTGQAVTIDVGEPNDIHPRNKQDVGARLALVARSVVYGHDVVSSGPAYRRHAIRDGRVVIEFDHTDGGLVSRTAGDGVVGFAVASDDRRFVWARARIDGNRVVVWSDQVPQPAAVRYAWSNSPPTPSLYNGAGLPAAPFRTDRW
jgi:sialate O-acetylesterase